MSDHLRKTFHQLYSKAGAQFKKRFHLDPPETKEDRKEDEDRCPSCPLLVNEVVLEFFTSKPELAGFGVEFTSGSEKSFVVQVNKDGWAHYVEACG